MAVYVPIKSSQDCLNHYRESGDRVEYSRRPSHQVFPHPLCWLQSPATNNPSEWTLWPGSSPSLATQSPSTIEISQLNHLGAALQGGMDTLCVPHQLVMLAHNTGLLGTPLRAVTCM
jgi:hypothetical protein